jgi:hypothetical protein
MNARNYQFTETVIRVNEIRKTKTRHTAGHDYRMGNLKYPIIDWQAWWWQLYHMLVRLLSVAQKLVLTLFAFAKEQLVNLKRYLMIKEELLAEAFYETMDSFFVMGTVAEVILVPDLPSHQNFASSGQQLMHVSAAEPIRNVHAFSLTYGFSKNDIKANKSTRWTNDQQYEQLRYRQMKLLKSWVWKRWFSAAAGVLYLNNIMHAFLKIRLITAHPEIGADYLKC